MNSTAQLFNYDRERDQWSPRCPYDDECSGCDARGYCQRGRDGNDQQNTVFLEVYKATLAGDAIQISIGNGRHGYRIAGPKFGASGSQLLKRVTLSKRDADEIKRYLDEVNDASLGHNLPAVASPAVGGGDEE